MSDIKTIPLSTDDIMSLFTTPDAFILVDYNGSRLKTEAFITYVTNMKMNCDLVNYQTIPYEDKAELLNLFIAFKYPVNCLVLKKALAAVLLSTRSDDETFDYFTLEESKKYIAENSAKLAPIMSFYDSMLFVLPSLSVEYKEQIFEPALESGEIETIDDIDAVGINSYGLIEIPNFIDFFIGLSTEEIKPKYYKYQIENFIYNKKTLFSLILDLKGSSLLMSLFNLLTSTEKEEVTFFEELKKGA